MENKKKSIYISKELHKILKLEAIERGITLQELLEEILTKHTT